MRALGAAGDTRILHQFDAARCQLQHGILVSPLLQQPVRQQLVDVASDLVGRCRTKQAKGAEPRMAAGGNLLVVGATQHVGDVSNTETLPHARDAGENLSRQ